MRDPVILDFPGLLVAGVSFWGNPFDIGPDWTQDNAIGQTWNRFGSLSKGFDASLFAGERAYEIHVSHPETARTGFREVFVGREPVPGSHIPLPLSLKQVPSSTCALALLEGRDIVEGWDWLYGEWMRREGWKPGDWLLQAYDSRFKGLGPGELEVSAIEAYIPVSRP